MVKVCLPVSTLNVRDRVEAPSISWSIIVHSESMSGGACEVIYDVRWMRLTNKQESALRGDNTYLGALRKVVHI